MDKKAAKRKIVWDQTIHLTQLTHFTGPHLTDLHIGDVSRAVTNTGKYAVPVFYIRVPGDDPETIFQRLAWVREKRTVFSKHGIILRMRRGETTSQGWDRLNLTFEERREIDRMRARFKRAEMPKLEWEADQIIASSAAEPVPDSTTADSRQWPSFLTSENGPVKSRSSPPHQQPNHNVLRAKKTAGVTLPKPPAPPQAGLRRSLRLPRISGE